MPGWLNSDRRDYLPVDWSRRRKERLRIDGDRCTSRVYVEGRWERCPSSATDVDHINGRDNHDVYRDLRSICEWHHDKKSSREGAMAYHKRMKEVKGMYRRIEKHPRT